MRNLVRLAAIVAIVWLMYRLAGHLMTKADALTPEAVAMKRALLAVMLLSYALMIAVPFVPGIEIGLTMIAMGGSSLAPPVYLATLAGLVLAFCVGRWMPHGLLVGLLADLRLHRMARMVEQARALTPAERLEALRGRMPRRLGRMAVGWRYLWLALLVNLPGSALIGGGGGICLMAGLSRLFATPQAIATLALAILPLPLGAWLWWPGLLAP